MYLPINYINSEEEMTHYSVAQLFKMITLRMVFFFPAPFPKCLISNITCCAQLIILCPKSSNGICGLQDALIAAESADLESCDACSWLV